MEGKRTGVEEYTLALLDALFTLDRENEYVLFFNAWKKEVPVFLVERVGRYPHVTLRVFRFPNKLLNLALWYLRWPKLDQLVGGTEVFFLPNLNFASVSNKTKLVVTAHDLSFELFPETFSLKRRLWHFFVNFRRLILAADRVIAVSRSTRDDLRLRYGPAAKKVSVIPSGVGQQFRVMSRNASELGHVQAKYHLPYKFILALMTFEPRKNLLALIESYTALRALRHPAYDKHALVLAGTCGWKCEEIFEAIERSPFRADIHLPGNIDDSDKAALYNLASVFVYPSFYEGFGFPPLEAMACGAPVIVSHSSSLPEVVGEAGILIDPYQPEELFLALREVLDDSKLREDLRARGSERAARFTWEATARATLAVFQIVYKENTEQKRERTHNPFWRSGRSRA